MTALLSIAAALLQLPVTPPRFPVARLEISPRSAAHADRHGLQPPRGPAGGCGVFLLRQSPGGERDGRWTAPRPGPGSGGGHGEGGARRPDTAARGGSQYRRRTRARARDGGGADGGRGAVRSEEHTSELQSPCNLVCRLLLEKKKQTAR